MIQYDEWLGQLAEFGLGWMGWTEQEVLRCDLNALVIAKQGRDGMLTAIFGESKPKTVVPSRLRADSTNIIPLTPELFDRMFDKPRPKR